MAAGWSAAAKGMKKIVKNLHTFCRTGAGLFLPGRAQHSLTEVSGMATGNPEGLGLRQRLEHWPPPGILPAKADPKVSASSRNSVACCQQPWSCSVSATAHLGHRAVIWGHRLEMGKPVLCSAPGVRTLSIVGSSFFVCFRPQYFLGGKLKRKTTSFIIPGVMYTPGKCWTKHAGPAVLRVSPAASLHQEQAAHTQNLSYCIHHFCCTIGNILSSSAKCTHPNHSPPLSQPQPQNESKPRVKENQNAALTFQLHRVASSVCQALGLQV